MKSINRRDFLGGIGIGVAGTLTGSNLMIPHIENIKNTKKLKLRNEENIKPLDVKIGIKPVMASMIHTNIWEGPCRPSGGVGPDKERIQAKNSLKELSENVKKNISQDAKILESVYIKYGEDLRIGEEEFKKLDTDKEEVDLYLVTGTVCRQYPATMIGERYKKPIAMIGTGITNVDCAAYLRRKGLEGYAPFDYDDLNNLISILRARKVFQQTNILIITDRGIPAMGVMSCIYDLEDLKNRFDIDFRFISIKELSDEMDRVMQSKDIMEKAENFADKLIKNAQECHIDRKYIIRDVEFYFAVRNLMKKYNSNAFTLDCFEICSTGLPEKRLVVPCLTHTLLKDEGYASACEGDINALLAMRLLMSVSKKSSFMGNSRMIEKNAISINHSVPGMKMNGFDKPSLPYHLRNFVSSGWGTKIQIDFTKPIEKEVTLARFNPFATKILATKGEIIGCTGFNKGNLIGCSLTAVIKVADARKFIKKQVDYGHHLAMVYGDYTKELDKLASIINIEVEFVT